MNYSKEVAEMIQGAIINARVNKYRYVTPEGFLWAMTMNDCFREAFEACDGDTQELVDDLIEYMESYVDKEDGDECEFSFGARQVLTCAEEQARNASCNMVGVEHVLHGMFSLKDSYAVYYVEKQGIEEVDLLRLLKEIQERGDFDGVDRQGDQGCPEGESRSSENWQKYAPCLNHNLKLANPLIGREEELARTIQILCRKDKNNPLHIGETGVGKTAITYGLVKMIDEGRVPEELRDCRVYELDLGGMLAGTHYRGDFEKRFKSVLTGIEKDANPIIYLDEIHNLAGAGAVGESSFDAGNMLKPYLSGGHIRFIGATTFDEYKKHFEKNKSLVRRFQNVEIKEPSVQETVEILNGLREQYEEFHGVQYEEGVFEYAVTMSAKYVNERFLPDKAIDLIDEAGAYRKLHPIKGKRQTVGKDVINEVLTSICRVPIETVKTDEMAGLATLEKRLKAQIFGQDEAVTQVVNAIKFSKAGLLEEGKPLANLLFVGPTGVGKTEIARTLAKELGIKLVRFDMSEYGEKHTVAKLIGSSAGYVGYEEGGILTEEIRKNPSCVLLLDEIEKAHSDVFNVLLQVMDYATLTDNQGRKADFRNVILIMTSNAGANRLGKPSIGFERALADQEVLDEEVKRTFQPEFRNRLNGIVKFHGMDEKMGTDVVGKKLCELTDALKKKGVRLKVDAGARKLLKKKGISAEFGAREIDRVIRNQIKPLLVDDILFGDLKKGGSVTISAQGEAFVVRRLEGE